MAPFVGGGFGDGWVWGGTATICLRALVCGEGIGEGGAVELLLAECILTLLFLMGNKPNSTRGPSA